MWNRDSVSLRTSKAWKSWHRVRVAKAMVLAAVYGIMGYVIVFVFTPAFLLGMGFCAMLCSFLMLRILYLIGGDPDAVYEEQDHDKN